MATMNTKKKAPRKTRKLNHEGAVTYKLDALEDLFSKVLGSFFGESTAYESRDAEKEFNKLLELVNQVDSRDKEYVLKIAQLGREHNMISYPLQILTACFNLDQYKGHEFVDPSTGKNKLGFYSDMIIRRALDITEILATQTSIYDFSKVKPKTKRNKLDSRRNRNVPLPMQLRKCLKAKLESFDNYKLSKGLSKGKSVSLKDAICILRPRPDSDAKAVFYKDIIEGNVALGNGKTQIRSALSQAGQGKSSGTKDIKDSVYKGTVQNILYGLEGLKKAGALDDEDVVKFIRKKFTNKDEIRKSKLLPFRFYSAYKALGAEWGDRPRTQRNVEKIRESIIDAMELSIENVSTIQGVTAVLVDISGSMDYKISQNSSASAKEMACILGAIAYKKGFGDLFMFANKCSKFTMSRRTPIIEMVNIMLQNKKLGNGTDLCSTLASIENYAEAHKTKYDNLIILSDNDCYGYNKLDGKLKLGERYNFFASSYCSADEQLSHMQSSGTVKKMWINNLLGNDFSIVNTAQHSKNLITGFSEKFVDIIEVHNCIGGNADIRQVVDMLLEKNI